MTEQLLISGLPVNASVITDEQGATCIRMLTSEVNINAWANVARSAGFFVEYQYMSGRATLDCICVDTGGNYRGIYSRDFCTVWIGRDELFS